MTDKFAGGDEKCVGLSKAYASIATELDCHFFDAGSVTRSSTIDGVHLDADQHAMLGVALAAAVRDWLPVAPMAG